MLIRMIEACDPKDTGSMGAHYIVESAKAAGFVVELGSGACDVELVSVHHCEDLVRLVMLPKSGKVRIVGGHIMVTNYHCDWC